MDLLQLSIDDATDSDSEQQPFDTSTLAASHQQRRRRRPERNDIHEHCRSRKNMVPFLKSNYKYKRRSPQVCATNCDGECAIAQVITAMTVPPQLSSVPEQVEVERFRHRMPLSSSRSPPASPLLQPLAAPASSASSDSYFRVVAVGLIVSAAVIVFRDILLSLCERVVRETRVWCRNSNKLFSWLSAMLVDVKRFTLDGWSVGRSSASRWRGGMTSAVTWSKSFSCLEYVSASLKLIYLTIFIGLWMTAYEVEAGTCWMERMDNGKCETVYSKNMTKAQCCGKNQMFSYTEKNLSNVEYFFALALGGGTECVPCLESCKNVVCGPNKRCVKRKGRPKCVCSPQCGSGKKHKKSHKRKQHQLQLHQQNGSHKPPHVIDISRSKEHVSLVNFHSPITIRDTRSLSSEINNSNPSSSSFSSNAAINAETAAAAAAAFAVTMELSNPADHISQLNSRRKNQRMPIISTNPITTTTTSTKKHHRNHHHHRVHHHHHHHDEEHEQEQNDHLAKVPPQRRHAKTDRTKGDQLIITADDLVRPSTERDNDLAESNSLRIRTDTETDTDTHHHTENDNSRHHFKKHAKPKRKINDKNPTATHNSFHNGTSMMTIGTTTSARNSRYRNEMKIADRIRHRPPSSASYEGFGAAAFASAAGLDQGFKHRKPMPVPHQSNNKNTDHHLGHQDNTAAAATIADDQTFDDTIHNGFFSNGFPYPHQELMSTDEGRYTHPVCGSDGRTYNTECQLKKRACRTDNSALVVAYRGHCQTSCKKVNCMNGLQCVEDNYAIPHCIVCSIQCPADDNTKKIDPTRAVCGVDGNTYKSTCDINRMVCKIGRSIAVAYPGPCREERSTCSEINCGSKMSCLTDLLTHRPRCVSCKFKCSRKRRPTNIRYEEGKLCGNNNRTYNSWCEMKKDSCQTGLFIDIKSIGECKP